ncbi:MAG: pyruvate ferredoxin/flavodoxin oxidoreductase [Panacagrimonas sp.]|nr:indolepyruvate ferredoxin oxidoreductase family protein [Panacagrimonas sp.]MCC2658375.1 pyruvate ferredoxin/flavodoxin oxidoreductase [Panacagrimonas sp.]
MSLAHPDFRLDDVYTRRDGPIFMTGIQALVRLPMEQRLADRARGLNTAGLVSGYRGSPLGAYDQQLWKAQKHLAAHDVVFQPGLNEDLAATALWGAQVHRAYGPSTVDGVFGVWYGKGPGVDRTGDAFRSANIVGTSKLGGVLAVAGDDHSAQSSVFPHQTDGIFQAVSMPILQPASVEEILRLGLAGFAMSRHTGLWVAMKTVAEVVETAASFTLASDPPEFVAPEGAPDHGLNWDPRLTWPAQRAELERRLIDERLPAALAWARANHLNRPVVDVRGSRLCVVTVGKAHQDLMQAVCDLGLREQDLRALGVAVFKVAMSWPLESGALLDFADGCDELLVIEEKQPVVETQLKDALYHRPAARRPRVTGKTDVEGRPLLPAVGEFDPVMVARVLRARLAALGQRLALPPRLAQIEAHAGEPALVELASRKAYFCSGCPHATSTKTPEGSISGGGIGCHIMALSQPALKTPVWSHMGAEGVQWIGAAPFSLTPHVFQNLGDGTYQHSGLLAVRAAVAARTRITFKILYNDAVAMTGGQPAEGNLDPARITRQLAAEGVERIVLVSDDPSRWERAAGIADGVAIRHRDELDTVQRQLREAGGVTAIIYEQTCAAEKRRRRKKKQLAESTRRLFINPRVCEGCGDCSVQSSCIAVEPLDTDFGRKRRINQSSCNTDLSCVKGFCPSFVEVDAPVLRKPDPARLEPIESELFAGLPAPDPRPGDGVCNLYVAGVGGTGVLTIGALIGSAAYFDGKQASVLDFTGMAQKNGAVVSQVRIAPRPGLIHAVRIGAADIDVLIGADFVTAAAPEALRKLAPGRSAVVLNTDETPTADIVSDRDTRLPAAQLIEAVLSRAASGQRHTLQAHRLAEGLFGDTVAANTMLLGYAWQKGLVPLSCDAIRQAIRVNGAAVSMNLRAFDWGRVAAVDADRVAQAAGTNQSPQRLETVQQRIDRHAGELARYQDARYAARYRALMQRTTDAAASLGGEGRRYVAAVAANAYKLMAYKDEYEVARLYSEPEFRDNLRRQFSGHGKLGVWLAPPLISPMDPATGRPKKRRFGAWIFPLFTLLARFKGLRGTPFDVFGYSTERRAERRLVAQYFETIEQQNRQLSTETLPKALALASIPDQIRGFGPVKMEAMENAERRREALLTAGPPPQSDVRLYRAAA